MIKRCNKEQSKEYKKQWYLKNKQKISKQRKEHHEKYPWKRILNDIKQRCNNLKNKFYHRYGGRGIECRITEDELEKLWFRDKAYNMDKPSIDREDNDGDYILSNCRFIEMVENSIKDRKKSINQYNLDGEFVREWKGQTDASIVLDINQGSINNVLLGKQKTASGFKWRFKNV